MRGARQCSMRGTKTPFSAFLSALSDLTLAGVTTGGGDLNVLQAGGFTLTSGAIDVGTGSILITADEIDFTGGADSVSSSGGSVQLQPTDPSVSIDIGSPLLGTGTLDISDTDIA